MQLHHVTEQGSEAKAKEGIRSREYMGHAGSATARESEWCSATGSPSAGGAALAAREKKKAEKYEDPAGHSGRVGSASGVEAHRRRTPGGKV